MTSQLKIIHLKCTAEIEPPDTGRISSTTTKRGSSSQTINTSATLTTSYNDTITENTITSTLRSKMTIMNTSTIEREYFSFN